DALPEALRGAWGETAAEIVPQLAGALSAGDVIMVKGSNASRMGPLVEALKARYATPRSTVGEQETA
ncbi:MAG: UDP-N-acetylmuramoylalanyl-D-glutamyl-2, 6-diaminopimelate--D-alanyl-D-alanine ligase, partial [Planctomycetota bacterium]|nr:UDP-N-acetylmuramoylalanyl-D-glutamyl-2, 6-diaminopimelate--D-alanyl-D-alanine ligase [Planctomycetota bacterium]